MYKTTELQQIIDSEFQKLYFPKNPAELYQPIEYILSIGGKRIRPLFTVLAANLFSEDVQNAINPAIGLEIFHNFTLLHDDIMDKADIRRNKPTVHKKWNENVAILSGDAMMIYSYEFFMNLPTEIQISIFKTFNKTAIEVCEGQQFDMNFENKMEVSEQEYIKMIELKTSVLIAACFKIGAICGGANEKDAENMYEFGKNLGLAFQLRDDYLDCFGNTAEFGKQIGGDIVANKKTYLLIKALNISDSQTKAKIIAEINKKDFDRTEKVNTILEIYQQLNIPQITEKKIEEYYNLAFSYFDKISVPTERKTPIIEFVNLLKNRKS
ncbi:MAG TPA: isoprenyl synthetase [Bacteroidales bacterium]|nr:MAG: isoprenyl synthetase [Bacteroidetes bacterium GWF2_33_38]OFY76292.1 MAG: isoprenyl synthetase [Bacteroidetes bacterium RIFOXYA12_FULL_33_9]OFY89714.1 MAG: isoprenyl synthetase [Bacteroidetes bacterium RIFOXYA2_FULL_33_7]HBF88061.1 isoprenyl synthetase [Bacteroidales bacterium]